MSVKILNEMVSNFEENVANVCDALEGGLLKSINAFKKDLEKLLKEQNKKKPSKRSWTQEEREKAKAYQLLRQWEENPEKIANVRSPYLLISKASHDLTDSEMFFHLKWGEIHGLSKEDAMEKVITKHMEATSAV